MFYFKDDRYIIVKRKNANGSKTPPRYQSKEFSTSPTRKGNSFGSAATSNYYQDDIITGTYKHQRYLGGKTYYNLEFQGLEVINNN